MAAVILFLLSVHVILIVVHHPINTVSFCQWCIILSMVYPSVSYTSIILSSLYQFVNPVSLIIILLSTDCHLSVGEGEGEGRGGGGGGEGRAREK